MLKRIVATITAIVITLAGGGVVSNRSEKKNTKPISATCSQMEIYNVNYCLSQNEYNTICSVVMAESGGEPYIGQQAVAQAILNACRLNGKRPLEIVKDYQYAKNRPTPTESVKKAVESVFCQGEKVIDSRVTIFYAPKICGRSNYHESQIYSCTIGGHKFFVECKFADKRG